MNYISESLNNIPGTFAQIKFALQMCMSGYLFNIYKINVLKNAYTKNSFKNIYKRYQYKFYSIDINEIVKN